MPASRQSTLNERATKDAHVVRFPISGMTCQACAISVEKALESVPGVREAEVNFGSRSARVLRDPETAQGAALRSAVTKAGYGVPEDAGLQDS